MGEVCTFLRKADNIICCPLLEDSKVPEVSSCPYFTFYPIGCGKIASGRCATELQYFNSGRGLHPIRWT